MKAVVRDEAAKLKNHRLKPGGVRVKAVVRGLAVKLKDHRLKPGGVRVKAVVRGFSGEIEGPPAEARWCQHESCCS